MEADVCSAAVQNLIHICFQVDFIFKTGFSPASDLTQTFAMDFVLYDP